LNTNKIAFHSTAALVLGFALSAFPAVATTISFGTTATPSNVGVGGADFTFTGASVSSFDPTAGVFFNGLTTGTSFGAFSFASGTPTSNVVDVKVAPTVNGGSAAVVDFQGTITPISGTTQFMVNFSGTTGSTAGTGSLAGYTQLVSNGVTYAVKTVEQLNTGTLGKQTWLNGYIQGVGGAVVPEPATLATTGLALALVGFAARRKAKANS
jgi:hypothetical protein